MYPLGTTQANSNRKCRRVFRANFERTSKFKVVRVTRQLSFLYYEMWLVNFLKFSPLIGQKSRDFDKMKNGKEYNIYLHYFKKKCEQHIKWLVLLTSTCYFQSHMPASQEVSIIVLLA